MTKFIVVTGGVLSGLGKGIVSASIARLLPKDSKIVTMKCDGYLNVDPGTINPYKHGEVFVLEDGGEVDLDFGHYERFLSIKAKFNWNLTSGKIFQTIIEKERRGDFLGDDVQMIPHVTDEIKHRYKSIAKDEKADFVLIEIGGTVGDLENMLFLEAIRQLKLEVGTANMCHIHLGLVPEINGEQKTKPIQQSITLLQNRGLLANIIIARSKTFLEKNAKQKIALFGNISKYDVISDPDIDSVYELPLVFEKEDLRRILEQKLSISLPRHLSLWEDLVKKLKSPEKEITVAICGKYTDLTDAYISVQESLVHAGTHLKTKVNIKWIESTNFDKDPSKIPQTLENIDGIIIPGGFGSRGTEGKISIINYARKNNIPFLGLCLGLQLAVVEFARNVANLKDAHSSELNKDAPHKVVDILPDQVNIDKKGGTMRLGAYPAYLKENSKVKSIYNQDVVYERHRHRYEVNPECHKTLEDAGLIFSGLSEDKKLVEFIELQNHPFFIATQAHPELKSTFEKPAPLFLGFVDAINKK